MTIIVIVLYRLLVQDKASRTLQTPVASLTATAIEGPIPNPVALAASKILAESNIEPIVEKFYCLNHKDAPSSGSCLMCEEVFCENCLVEHEGMFFCREHFKIFANNKWVQITDEKTTPSQPEEGLYIWNFKRHLWKSNSVPTFVLTHYKINIHEDFIESYVQLNVRQEDAENLKTEIKNYKAKH